MEYDEDPNLCAHHCSGMSKDIILAVAIGFVDEWHRWHSAHCKEIISATLAGHACHAGHSRKHPVDSSGIFQHCTCNCWG